MWSEFWGLALGGRSFSTQWQQKNIMDYFKISQTQQAVAGRTKNVSIKEELVDPFFAEGDDSSISNVMDTSGDSSPFPEDEYMENSRKRPLSATAPDRLKIEHDLWGEPEKKAVLVHPEHSQIKQELDDIEIEPVPDAHYRLLGTRNWEVPQGSIEDLPDEVLRSIFAFLPVTDLYQSMSLVCHRWRDIVGDPRIPVSIELQGLFEARVFFESHFIPWKKLYHQYLMKEDMALRRVERVFEDFAITDQHEECILGLIRIHYNIFYCLYLVENASVTAPRVVEEEMLSSRCRQDFWSSSLSEVKLTHEQQRILNHKIERGQIVKIMAFAGTGKTSTLVKYAEKFADLSFLYVTFNKAVAERGRLVFPRNVTCKTFHSLAFGSVGRRYKEKGRLNFSKLSAYSVSFLIQNREGQSIFIRGKTVSQTLENFFASSDEEICEEHTPIWFKNTHGERRLVSRAEKEINVAEAKEIWHNMKKLDGDVEGKYKITCDGYLKLWQLSKPQLSGYDAIFVDEAQDCTPAIVDIVLSQTCGVILSFRFGPEIAYVGATILDVCKGIRNKTLVGGNQEGDVRGSMEGKITMLSRSNINVFEDAVKLVGRERQIKIHIIGGLVRFGLSKIYDIWKLSQPADERERANLVINDSFIKRWEETEGFIGLKEYATRVDDRELEMKIRIVEKFKERIPELVQKIESSHVSQEAMADYLIGTVHQAKGLEFDTVLVADDFIDVPCASGNNQRRPQFMIGMYPEDEWNLLYVAVTRAKKCLLMSQSLEHLLALAGEHFLRVELMGEAVKSGLACCAQQCTQMLQSGTRLVVKKLPLIHSNGSRDMGGYLCYSCVQKRFGTMTPLAFLPALQEEPIVL
ncbi:hypothetical protein ASZ78_007715 [Callipepla squamata]|uniref:F-box domain-containing protein n=1 Tax=Callipepla squamata TaxID=9009 RepID=A0A226MRV5_CALSU|nr:hypothetical protein ASZ78_007715 [Callipepla squamata]